MMVVKPNKNHVDKLYLYYFLSRANLQVCISGATQPQITRKDLSPFLTTLPPIFEQKKIVVILKTTQKEVYLLQQLVGKIRTQKRGLMQKLLTVCWRIKNE